MIDQIKDKYTKSFYGDSSHRMQNAKIVFDKLFTLIHTPQSLVDVGCGLGHWLDVANRSYGIKKILGVDGNYVKERDFLIPKENFIRHNLEQEFIIDEKFDLCISIETAEHLTPNKASQFIRTLTALSNLVLFSGAAPFQKGINHLNENTPTYWAEKFSENEFLCFDIIRDLLWDDEEVNCIYPQNILLFVHRCKAKFLEDKGYHPTPTPQLKYHPRFIERRLTLKHKSPLKKLLRKLAY